MTISIEHYKERIQFLKGKAAQLQEDLFLQNIEKRKLKKELDTAKKAQAIIQYAAQATQKKIEYSISEITSLSLSAVFDRPYKFICRFKKFGSKSTHCDFLFSVDGEEIDPTSSDSGGACNIAALGLLCTIYTLTQPKTRPILFIEEPFLELKGRRANIRGLKLINLLSRKLGIQFIIISDERVDIKYIKKYSDKVFKATMEKGISIIKEIK